MTGICSIIAFHAARTCCYVARIDDCSAQRERISANAQNRSLLIAGPDSAWDSWHHMTYVLHYAPDNASLPVRLVLEEMGLPYETVLVNRATQDQRSPAYLALNPNGLIPVLETGDGPIFETAAILLWLGDRHNALVEPVTSARRGAFLTWLFFLSNTLHADLRALFYSDKYVGGDQSNQNALRSAIRTRLQTHLQVLNRQLGAHFPDLSVLDYYLASMMRWMALYPAGSEKDWFSVKETPHLYERLQRVEARPAAKVAQIAEGLGETPFTAPRLPVPPEGSAT